MVKRVYVPLQTLADGASTAKIYRFSAGHHQADAFANGAKISTLDANGRAAYGEKYGLHVALQPDGQLTSWVDDLPAAGATALPDTTAAQTH